jgi:hypothetical protein
MIRRALAGLIGRALLLGILSAIASGRASA